MRVRNALAGMALCALGASGAPAQDDAPRELVLKLPRGKRWTVVQKLTIHSDNTDSDGTSIGPDSGNAEVTLLEEWTDTSLKDSRGKVKSLERTWQKAQVSVTHGSTWEGAPAVDGCVLKLEGGRRATKVTTVRGTPEARTLALLKGPPPDAVSVLLPTKRVKVGATWKIKPSQVVVFVDGLVAAVPSIKPEGALVHNILTLLRTLQPGTVTIAPVPALEAKLVRIEDGRATIEARGTAELPKQGTPPRGGGECACVATLVLAVDTGVPVSLSVKITNVQAPGPGSGFARAGPNGVEEVGLDETWTITRRYELLE